MKQAIAAVVLGIAITTAIPASTLAQERPSASTCLWPCRDCERAAKDNVASCWRASATCCQSIGRKPILRSCGCW